MPRSEERFSRNAETDLVCRLLLEKKKNISRLNRSCKRFETKFAMSIMSCVRTLFVSSDWCAYRKVVSVRIFFFNFTAPTEIYTLSLHDALPIYDIRNILCSIANMRRAIPLILRLIFLMSSVQQECRDRKSGSAGMPRPISYAVFCLKKKKTFRG